MTRFRKILAVGVVSLALVALVACAPQAKPEPTPQSDAKTQAEAAEEPTDEPAALDFGYANFADESSGIYPENYYTKNYMNSGNRGCNSCHEDLWELVVDRGNLVHLASTEPGYGKNANWLDCQGCHKGNPFMGMSIMDSIHGAHYTNEIFTEELGGTCFNCHAINSNGEYVMWDLYRYSPEFGGFKNASAELTTAWMEGRGFTTDTIAGITVQSNMPIEVSKMTQDVSDKKDAYSASNYAVPEIDMSTWALKVTGVNEERSFTLEELQALPQTERVITISCSANGLGSYQIQNMPVKGVRVKDIVDACGGLQEGMQSVDFFGADGWGDVGFGTGSKMNGIDTILNELDAIVMLEYWGEPLSEFDGFPATIALPGIGGGSWVKWLTEIGFRPEEGYASKWDISKAAGSKLSGGDSTNINAFSSTEAWHPYSSIAINLGWMDPINEGETLKMENGKVSLSGYAYLWGQGGHRVGQLAFSADYGRTWSYVDVPETLDPYQWVTWTVDWQPEKPGTYVLYASAIDAVEGWQKVPTPITVVVE